MKNSKFINLHHPGKENLGCCGLFYYLFSFARPSLFKREKMTVRLETALYTIYKKERKNSGCCSRNDHTTWAGYIYRDKKPPSTHPFSIPPCESSHPTHPALTSDASAPAKGKKLTPGGKCQPREYLIRVCRLLWAPT